MDSTAQHAKSYHLHQGSKRLRTPRNNRTSVLLYMILFSSVLNAFQGLLIALGFAWLSKPTTIGHVHNSVQQPIYRDSVTVVDKPIYPERLYDTVADSEATDELIGSFNPDDGVVALLRQPHVLRSEQFPWDASKDIYVLASYHSLQSIQVIWQTLRKLSDGKPLSTHAIHSLNVLWDDVQCTADMTPRSVAKTVLSNRTAISEAGQIRQCRDWDAVEALAKAKSACFKDMGAAKRKSPLIQEWQHCPQGSPYQGKVNEWIAQSGV